MDTWLIAEQLRTGSKTERCGHRCAEGWTDSNGVRCSCREADTREVDGRWLCWYHSLLAAAEKCGPTTAYETRYCCVCVARMSAFDRQVNIDEDWQPEPNRVYRCPACGDNWIGARRAYDIYGESADSARLLTIIDQIRQVNTNIHEAISWPLGEVGNRLDGLDQKLGEISNQLASMTHVLEDMADVICLRPWWARAWERTRRMFHRLPWSI